MKTVLVTGGNRGIGLEICRQLDELGFMVVLGSRDLHKGEVAAQSYSKNVVVKQLDVTNEDSIQALFKYFENEYGKLDVLINNAGIGESDNQLNSSVTGSIARVVKKKALPIWRILRPIIPFLRKAGLFAKQNTSENVTMVHAKHIMNTNFYGPWRMCQVFTPLLAKSDDARIINVSSGMGQLQSLTGNSPAYSLSKSALNALTIMLSNELIYKKIKVNAMCPGWVRTDMGGPQAPRDVKQGADTAVWLSTENEVPTGKFFKDRIEIPW